MNRSGWLLAAGLIAATLSPAVGQEHTHHPGAQAGPGAAKAETAATRDFKGAHQKMMQGMSLPYTGDPDVDFRVQMIPHHQGAIDMARVALQHATDPATRQLAETVIAEQEREISDMRAWLAHRGVAVPSGG